MSLRFILVLLLLSTLPTQDHERQVEFKWVRFERISNTVGHEIKECILVRADGTYRRERWEELALHETSAVPASDRFSHQKYVFAGALAPSELDRVRNLVESPSFRAVKGPEKLRMSNEFFAVQVARGSGIQQFQLSASADYKPNETALKPVFAWMKSMTERKGDVSKEQANLCSPR